MPTLSDDPLDVQVRETGLDRIVTQLLTILHHQTTDVVLAGNLLIESRKHLNHGEWQPWLAENFDLNREQLLQLAHNRLLAYATLKHFGISLDHLPTKSTKLHFSYLSSAATFPKKKKS
jgi:hypothetical protein